jgi:hypothetical protein
VTAVCTVLRHAPDRRGAGRSIRTKRSRFLQTRARSPSGGPTFVKWLHRIVVVARACCATGKVGQLVRGAVQQREPGQRSESGSTAPINWSAGCSS